MLRGGVGGAVAVLVMGLSACAGPGADASDSPRSTQSATAVAPSTESPSAPAPKSEPPSMKACSPSVDDSVRMTITGQQRAFAAGDFAGARAFSSRDFQSRVTVPQFEAIITTDYAFLLGGPSLAFASCVGAPGVAFVTVAVSGDPPVVMAYRVVEEANGWFIDSAGVIETGETGGSIEARFKA